MGSDFFSGVRKKFESFFSVNKFPEIPTIFFLINYPKIPLYLLARRKRG